MERSQINEILEESDHFIRSFGYVMPPFAYWSPEEMRVRTGSDAAAVRDNRLGWDITDYGQGRFDELASSCLPPAMVRRRIWLRAGGCSTRRRS